MALYGDIFDEMHIFPGMTVLLFFHWHPGRGLASQERNAKCLHIHINIYIYILLYKYGQEAPSGTYRVGYPKQVGSGT